MLHDKINYYYILIKLKFFAMVRHFQIQTAIVND